MNRHKDYERQTRIIAAIEILELSRLAIHHGDQVADGLIKSLVEVKDSQGVGRNVGVIPGEVEAGRVEPGSKRVRIGRIERLREGGFDGAIGHTQQFDKACAARFALERDQLLIGRPLEIATRRVARERLQPLSIHPHQLQPARGAGRASHEENPLPIGGNLSLVDGLIRYLQNLRFYAGYDIITIEGCCTLHGGDVDNRLMIAQS